MNSNHLPANWDLARGLERVSERVSVLASGMERVSVWVSVLGLEERLAVVQAQEARLAQAYRVGLRGKNCDTFLRIGLRKGTPSSVGRREQHICHGSPADSPLDRTLHMDSCRHPHEVSCRRCA